MTDAAALLAARADVTGAARPDARAARELSDVTDKAVSALAEAALSALAAPWALLALGGWGARRLLPHSDLDLLVVTDAPAAVLKPALQQMLYPLWDAGLKVGHQVRTRRDHLRVCRGDLDTLTATLTGRPLAGDGALAARVLAEVSADARRRRRSVLAALAARPRPGSPYLLEPDLKEGAGGQRDLDELCWSAAVLLGEPTSTVAALTRTGMLTETDTVRLGHAQEAITAARWAVHAASARPSNTLEPEVAADLKADAERVQAALADVRHLTDAVRSRIAGAPEPPLRPWSAEEVFTALDRGDDGVPALEHAAWAGLLDDLVPAFGELMHLRRPGLGHRYTVGAHSLRTAAGALRVAGRMALPAEARRTLAVAALLHDVGKAQRGAGHAGRGAAVVETIGSRFGLTPARTTDAATLVRCHLLLPETVGMHDIHDEDVVLRCADALGDASLVAPLLALTEADARATGAASWTPWQAALTGELAARIEAALSDEGAGVAAAGETVRDAVAGSGDPVAARFARAASLRYLAAHGADQVAAHAALAHEVAAAGDALRAGCLVTTGPADGTWRVTVAARDRTGLFATICGALAATGLDIVSADAYGAPDGVALDEFVVRPDTRADVDTATFAAFERTLRSGLADPWGLATRLAQRRERYRTHRGRGRGRPSVAVVPSDVYATAVRVTAPDRVGLLADIAGAIADEGLRIERVRALTRDGVATDVFHVTDAAGEPLADPGEIGHLTMRIRTRL